MVSQYYLPPDTGERAPPYPKAGKQLDLPTPERQKAE